MKTAYQRIQGQNKTLETDYGIIEYKEGGHGPAVLVIHGSGGGFDQGELIARTLIGESFRWVSPSRFGYLGSSFKKGATFDDQAHAFALLLDYLKIEKVAVVALSHGGPSALLLALHYPKRVTSLSLVSAGVASLPSTEQTLANSKGQWLVKIYKYDFIYWALTNLFKTQFLQLMGADNSVIQTLTKEQFRLVHEILESMSPASVRYNGALFDHHAVMPNERITGIKAPTIIFHSKDDRLQLFHNAEYANAKIENAKLVSFERGGHLIMCTEQNTIAQQLRQHILTFSKL